MTLREASTIAREMWGVTAFAVVSDRYPFYMVGSFPTSTRAGFDGVGRNFDEAFANMGIF